MLKKESNLLSSEEFSEGWKDEDQLHSLIRSTSHERDNAQQIDIFLLQYFDQIEAWISQQEQTFIV